MRDLWFRLRCWWHGYDPVFVRKLIEADGRTSEVAFNDIVGLLKWLDN